MSSPRIWPEPVEQRWARAILAHAAQDSGAGIEVRLAALDALGELEDTLPVGVVLRAVEAAPGTLAEAHRLLMTDHSHDGVRDTLAAARAAARLLPWVTVSP